MKVWETSDIGAAAYSYMRGLKLDSAARDRGGKFRFRFQDPDEQGDIYKIEYANSECSKFDAAVRMLKKICFDTSR